MKFASNLPFTCRQFPRIYVISLEGSKVGLDRAGLVAMWPGEEEWNIQQLHDIQECWRGVITGIVHHDNVGLTPFWPLRI